MNYSLLETVPTAQLRAELARRERAEHAAQLQQLSERYPCPCGAPLRSLASSVVREHRTAGAAVWAGLPSYWSGAPPKVEGATYLVVWECDAGHRHERDETVWFNERKEQHGGTEP